MITWKMCPKFCALLLIGNMCLGGDLLKDVSTFLYKDWTRGRTMFEIYLRGTRLMTLILRYLFTGQQLSKLWISRSRKEFIKKYKIRTMNFLQENWPMVVCKNSTSLDSLAFLSWKIVIEQPQHGNQTAGRLFGFYFWRKGARSRSNHSRWSQTICRYDSRGRSTCCVRMLHLLHAYVSGLLLGAFVLSELLRLLFDVQPISLRM